MQPDVQAHDPSWAVLGRQPGSKHKTLISRSFSVTDFKEPSSSHPAAAVADGTEAFAKQPQRLRDKG
jgi:hypothetical protein